VRFRIGHSGDFRDIINLSACVSILLMILLIWMLSWFAVINEMVRPIRQGYLNLTGRRRTRACGVVAPCFALTGANGTGREEPSSPFLYLPPPSGQKRAANAMPSRCGCHLVVANKAFLRNAWFVIIRPGPTAIAVGRGKNFDLRTVDKVGLIIGANSCSNSSRWGHTKDQSPSLA